MARLPINIRPATPDDMASVAEIHEHYVLNTVTTFRLDPYTVEQQEENLEKVQQQGLPYIVATTEASGVVGYSYLSGFRGGKGGYRHTVELTLYCHPTKVGQGVGSALLTKTLDIMMYPEEHSEEYLQGNVRPDDRKVRQIMAVMAVDTDSKDEGLGLKRYYEGFGFVLNGHLKQVGHKLDRWVDTMYLQKTLW